MPSLHLNGKRVILTLFSFVLLSSCSSATRQWSLVSNKGIHSDYCSSRLYLSPEDNFSGLEVDLLNTSQGEVIYINTFGLELQPEGKSLEGYSIITITLGVDDQSQNFMGFLLQGGHRILLQESANQFLIQALHENKCVKLSVAQCSTTIIPDKFAEHYAKIDQSL